MVDELVDLVRRNPFCKHLVVSTEENLIKLLQDDTRPDGSIELPPMAPFSRMLLHRLADIYGLSHESVGEGIGRCLILKRAPKSSIASTRISDLVKDINDDDDDDDYCYPKYSPIRYRRRLSPVEFLASKIKQNPEHKHLVLSMEEELITYIQNGASGTLELQPMSTLCRHLLHLLADLFGFSHESVGEGDARHLIFKQRTRTSIPSILVSEVLSESDDESENTEFDDDDDEDDNVDDDNHCNCKIPDISAESKTNIFASPNLAEMRVPAKLTDRHCIFPKEECDIKDFVEQKPRILINAGGCFFPKEERDVKEYVDQKPQKFSDAHDCIVPKEERDIKEECMKLIPVKFSDACDGIFPKEERDIKVDSAEQNPGKVSDAGECILPKEENDIKVECAKLKQGMISDARDCIFPKEEINLNVEFVGQNSGRVNGAAPRTIPHTLGKRNKPCDEEAIPTDNKKSNIKEETALTNNSTTI